MAPRTHAPALALALTLAFPALARAQSPEPLVDIYTMDIGDHLFTRFGHAAICVHDTRTPEGRCYNYGTTDFSTPGPLTWSVLRGRARFWVSVAPLERMLAFYGAGGENRTVYRQRLSLTPVQTARLLDRLDHDVRPENREYVYHHYRDNCTTRLRDHLASVTDGAFRARSDAVQPFTWRALTMRGFAPDPMVLAASDLLLGRALDASPTRWEAMFLPEIFRDEVAARLGARPEVVYQRPDPVARGGAFNGRAALLATAFALALITAVSRRMKNVYARRAGVAVAGLALGLAGLVVWVLAGVSSLAELRFNEVVLVLAPTDFALCMLGGPWLERYARGRLALLSLVALLALIGVLRQPIVFAVLLVLAVMTPIVIARAREPSAVTPRVGP